MALLTEGGIARLSFYKHWTLRIFLAVKKKNTGIYSAFFPEAWSVSFDKDKRVIDKYHWVSP